MAAHKLLVFQTDFGRLESTVAEMYGVALGVDPDLRIHETTHYIPQFDIWEASYRLYQAIPWWPAGTVFVSVVDPGVGSERRSVVARTKGGHFIVTPDNGSLTHSAARIGIEEIREIDESVNRLPGTAESNTFHGRDVYGYTGARLASNTINFEQVGPPLDPANAVMLPVEEPAGQSGCIDGIIEILDLRYGNIWTNIPAGMMISSGINPGSKLKVSISKDGRLIYAADLPYSGYFSAVTEGSDLVYNNELLYIALGTNQGSFAVNNGVESGPEWKVRFEKIS